MKKLVMLLMASLLVASTAFAVVDEDPDMLGVYFDVNADMTCMEGVAPYANVMTYIVLTNPSFDYLYGIEFGYDRTANLTILGTEWADPAVTDVGGPANHIVGFGSPWATSEATVVATLTALYLETTGAPATFSLKGSNPSSINPLLPTVLLANGELRTLGTSTLPGEVSAVINGTCEDVVATEPASFGAVKSLYR